MLKAPQLFVEWARCCRHKSSIFLFVFEGKASGLISRQNSCIFFFADEYNLI